LLAAALVAVAIRPGDAVVVGEASLAAPEFTRMFLLLGRVAGLGPVALGAVTPGPRELPAATPPGLPRGAIAPAPPQPILAVVAAGCGGFAGLLVTLVPPRTAAGTLVAARHAQAVAIALAVAIVAAAWTARTPAALAGEPTI